MKIVDLKTTTFRYRSSVVRDSEGHGHPGAERDATQTLLRIVSDEGASGYAFGADAAAVERIIKPAIVGEDPLCRERIWSRMKHRQRLHMGLLPDRLLCTVDLALWDLVGRALQQPVYKLLGGFREKVLAYASTMCGDDLPGGLDSPQAYARYALACKAMGYKAFKLHTWQPPMPGAPDPKQDIAACAAVREAVGNDMALMLDPYHYYSREQALFLAKELEKLNYHWMEEPMDEHSISSYVWLSSQTALPICGPETAEGQMYTRAEWIVRHASDISRAGVSDVGGLTPLMKIAGLCESFGVSLEIHGPGAGNLHALCAMSIPGEYYERGLLHPFVDYEQPKPWLKTLEDPLDADGYVHVSQRPGLGQDINFEYIQANAVG